MAGAKKDDTAMQRILNKEGVSSGAPQGGRDHLNEQIGLTTKGKTGQGTTGKQDKQPGVGGILK